MIITQLLGGLGNQMFQYAIGRRLAHEHDLELKVDVSVLQDHTPGRHAVNRTYDLDVFSLEVPIATRAERRWFNPQGLPAWQKALCRVRRAIVGTNAYHERSFRYDEALMKLALPPPYLSGLWQSYKYVEPIRELLARDFSFRREPPANTAELTKELRDPLSVCLNVRRGDFLSVPRTASILGFVGLKYYKDAVAEISRRLDGRARFFVFSDDLEWCREDLRWLPNSPVFVDHEFAGPKFSHYLYLMKHASHFVIPNSTFGWWAAWLAANPEKVVVAPKRWFRDEAMDATDLCPPDWVMV